ncbi:MAG: hypothetical protein H0U23_11435 [Blastocatellia bacterium]|nr:hypothetical protein [Blastocatellia bacterium]
MAWGHFAKLLNVILYEIASNRELITGREWKNLQNMLHVPIDSYVVAHVQHFDPTFPNVKRLKGMTEAQYVAHQDHIRRLADNFGVSPITFEAGYAN